MNQDQRAGNAGVAGLTFQFLSPVKTDYVTHVGNENTSPILHIAGKGWLEQPWDARVELNSGTHFAPAVEAVVKDVVKWSYNGQDNTLGSGTDKVFFISAQEFGSDYQNNSGTGTGVNHDEAYLYYQQPANNSIGLTQDVWTRTCRPNMFDMAYIRNGNVFLLDGGGNYGETRGKRAWVPLFCI